jgi:hypothetical protein
MRRRARPQAGLRPLEDDEIPIVRASVERAVVPGSPGQDR